MPKEQKPTDKTTIELIRSTGDEKELQIQTVVDFTELHVETSDEALTAIQKVATSDGNVFGQLLETTKVCTLGQISHALYQVGGQYRRNM